MMNNRTQKNISPGHFTRSLAQNARQSLLYLLIFIVLAVALSCICLFPGGSEWFDGLKALQLLAFIGVGLLHTSQLYKRLSFLHRNFSSEGLWFTLLLLTLVLLATTIFYLMINPRLLPISLACSGAFLFPFLMYRAWFFYSHIPPGIFAVWYLPEEDTNSYSAGSRNGQPVRMKLARAYFEVKDESFQIMATPQTKLGRLLYNVIAEQNKMPAATIQLKDEDDKPFGWEFYAKGLLGLINRRLNPEKSLLSNKVKKNTVVLVKRVRVDAPIAQQMIAV